MFDVLSSTLTKTMKSQFELSREEGGNPGQFPVQLFYILHWNWIFKVLIPLRFA